MKMKSYIVLAENTRKLVDTSVDMVSKNPSLVTAFRDVIFPYLVQIAVILCVIAIVSAAYKVFRTANWHEFFDKLKAALFAYAIVRGAFTIVAFINVLIEGINIPM